MFDPVSMNTAPVASGVGITGVAEVGQTLMGSYSYSDADDDPEGISTFRWLRDGTAIAGATGTGYVLTMADVSATITFEVTPVAQTGVSPGAPVVSPGVDPVGFGNYGDINYDGEVDAGDVLIVTRSLLEGPAVMQIIDVAPLVAGVPAPDGRINLGDLLIIQQMALRSRCVNTN